MINTCETPSNKASQEGAPLLRRQPWQAAAPCRGRRTLLTSRGLGNALQRPRRLASPIRSQGAQWRAASAAAL